MWVGQLGEKQWGVVWNYVLVCLSFGEKGRKMLDYIIERTNQYIDSMPKKERKAYGQFFTSKETARFMVGLYHIPENMSKICILDAGAGSGILACAFLERLE